MSNAQYEHISPSHENGENDDYDDHTRPRVGYAQAQVSSARCKRNSIKPGATPQVHNHQTIVALQAQKKCKSSAMSLLGWPRRSLFSIKVAKHQLRGATPVAIVSQMNCKPVGSNLCHGNAYGYFCACSAHCSCRDDTWGVAPGYKLLRLQRALIMGPFPQRLE